MCLGFNPRPAPAHYLPVAQFEKTILHALQADGTELAGCGILAVLPDNLFESFVDQSRVILVIRRFFRSHIFLQ